jgi:probable rRNA maturation factor
LSFEKVSSFKEETAEIIICPQIVRENAKESKLSLKKELAKILIHGILHVLGYDHEKSTKEADIMAEKEKLYFNKIQKTKS